MVSNIDKGDDLLGVLIRHPDKVNSALFSKLGLKADIFIFDVGQRHLFTIIGAASYSSSEVTEPKIEKYVLKHSLSADVRSDILIAFRRAKDTMVPFSSLDEAAYLFKNAVLVSRFRDILHISNNALNDGKKEVNDILLAHRESISGLLSVEEAASVKSVKGSTSEYIAEYEIPLDDYGVNYPFPGLAARTGRIKPGELHLVSAYTGEGKSMILLNIAYDIVVNQNKNVALNSLEMPSFQYKSRLYALHSTHPKFGRDGLEYEKIKERTLSADEKDFFYQVIRDFEECTDYGDLYFIDLMGANTVENLFSELDALTKLVYIHALVSDYISIMQGKGSNEREAIKQNFLGMKRNALRFYNGRGIPVISAHQISEEARARAEQSGKYDFNFLSDTSEAKKSLDCVIWLLRTAAHRETHEIGAGIAKLRDGVGDYNFSLFEQFKYCKASQIDTALQ